MSFFLVRLGRRSRILEGQAARLIVQAERLRVCLPNPACKLARVWDSRREKDDVDVIGKEDDDLFPDDASLQGGKGVRSNRSSRCEGGGARSTDLSVIDVVYLVEDDELDVADEVGALVKHAAEDLGGHLVREDRVSGSYERARREKAIRCVR